MIGDRRPDGTIRCVLDAAEVERYVDEHGLGELFDAQPRPHASPNEAVDPTVTEPKPPVWEDLVRLHRTIRTRRVTTVLEFGCGFSTTVMAHALAANKAEDEEFVRTNLRRNNPYELHFVDDMPEYVELTLERLPDDLRPLVTAHVSEVEMTTWQGRIATRYRQLPNVCPDFIYLDGPSQHSVHGDVSGIHTRHPDRLPMSCDLLMIEHFLLPGTYVIVDGRTANARFLRANLQRRWRYEHDPAGDVHTFEQVEPPLGELNRRQLEHCLGPAWLAEADAREQAAS